LEEPTEKAATEEDVELVSVEQREAEIACSIDNPDDCEMCGS